MYQKVLSASDTVNLTLDPVTPTFLLLPRTDMSTKFEEGKLRHYQVIDQKRF